MKKILAICVLLVSIVTMQAQEIKMNEITGNIKFEGGGWFSVGGALVNGLLLVGSEEIGHEELMSLFLPYQSPRFGWVNVYHNEEEISVRNPYFGFANWKDVFWYNGHDNVGYQLVWTNFRLPFTIFCGVDLSWRKRVLLEGPNAGRHSAFSVDPCLGLKWRVLGTGFERTNGFNFTVESQASYVHNFKYLGFNDYDPSVLNDGMRYRVSVGAVLLFKRGLRRSFSIGYEWENFDFFNADYVAPNGTRPFEGYTSKSSYLVFTYSFGF